MADTFGNTYNTGTVSATNGSPTLTFFGTVMTTQAVRGDWIYVPSLNVVVFVDAVVDDTHITLSSDWNLADATDVDYMLLKMSWSRYDPAITQAKVREYLSYLEGTRVFYFVEGDVPDENIGIDGQWAIKVNEGAWKIWYHVDGAWVYQGAPAGINLNGEYDADTTYQTGTVVSWQGKLWRSLVADNLGNQPDISPTQWELVLSGGDRYDFWFFDTDRPASNELVAKGFPVGVTFAVDLASSYAKAEVAATADAIYSFKKNGTEFATLTFPAGQDVGVWACPTATTFGAGDEFTMIAPITRDATLSGVGGTMIGYRNTGA